MNRRVFIAINLPESLKIKLAKFQSKWSDLPAKWTKKENLHITLAFLGYVQDDEIPEILRKTEEIAKKHKPFQLNFNKICYGPPKKALRMVWAMGEKSEELKGLQGDLENSLSNLPFKKENRSYSSHITLARIRQWEFKQIEPEERPQIEELIDLSFEVNSIELMESQLKRTGAKYIVLQSMPLLS